MALPFLALLEFQGVLSLVTCAALQGFPPRATGLALVEALVEQFHFNPQNYCKHWLLGDCVSSAIRLARSQGLACGRKWIS